MNTLPHLARPCLVFGALAASIAMPVATHAHPANDVIRGDSNSARSLIVPAATVTAAGTIKITVTLTLESSIGTDEAITCLATISTGDSSFINSATATGTVVIPTTGKPNCVLTIPYDWTMALATDVMAVSITLTTGNFATGSITRSLTLETAPFIVPASGIKSLSYTATM